MTLPATRSESPARTGTRHRIDSTAKPAPCPASPRSLSTINLNYHRSQSGPDSALWQYQIGTTGTWVTIGSFAGMFNSDHTSFSGASGTATLSLSGVPSLQNLAAARHPCACLRFLRGAKRAISSPDRGASSS